MKKQLERFGRAEPDDGSVVVIFVDRRYSGPGKISDFSKVSYAFFVPLHFTPLGMQF